MISALRPVISSKISNFGQASEKSDILLMIRRIDNDGIKEYSRFLRTSFSTFLPVFILYLSCYDGNFLWCNSSDTLSFKMSA